MSFAFHQLRPQYHTVKTHYIYQTLLSNTLSTLKNFLNDNYALIDMWNILTALLNRWCNGDFDFTRVCRMQVSLWGSCWWKRATVYPNDTSNHWCGRLHCFRFTFRDIWVVVSVEYHSSIWRLRFKYHIAMYVSVAMIFIYIAVNSLPARRSDTGAVFSNFFFKLIPRIGL